MPGFSDQRLQRVADALSRAVQLLDTASDELAEEEGIHFEEIALLIRFKSGSTCLEWGFGELLDVGGYDVDELDKMLSHLQREGWIVFQIQPAGVPDRYRLTARGSRYVDDLRVKFETLTAACFSRLNNEERQRLTRLLEKMCGQG